MPAEEVFEDIAQRSIEEAEVVDVDFASFVEGLRAMMDTIKHRLEAAESELRGMDD